MHRAAVELDDEALVLPRAVDLHGFDADVRVWDGNSGIDEEVLEALLQFASDAGQACLYFFDDGSEERDSRFARVPLDELAYPDRIPQPELLGLPERAAELSALNDSTEVEERARDGRGGNP